MHVQVSVPYAERSAARRGARAGIERSPQDDPRPGRPASISVDQVEAVVVATLEKTPQNATHWSRASMVKRSGLSKTTIGRIWKAFELKSHFASTLDESGRPVASPMQAT